MKYEVIYFSKYNMSAAKQAAGKAGIEVSMCGEYAIIPPS